MEDSFDLVNFIGKVGAGYVNVRTTADAAKIAQANASAAAANVASNQALSAKAKSLLIYGGAALLGIFLLVFIIKKVK